MKDQITIDRYMQKWRDRFMLFSFICLMIGAPVFTLQFGEYRLIQLYEKEGQLVEAKVLDLYATYFRWRTEYEIELSYFGDLEGGSDSLMEYVSITDVLHGNSFEELMIGDMVEILVLPEGVDSSQEGKALLKRATTMEYWGGYYWRMIIAGLATVYGVLSFIYAFFTRKQAVERVKRLAQAGK